MNKQKNNKGVTLVELVLGISVILIIIGIGILIFSNVQNGGRAYKIQSELLSLTAEIRKINPQPVFTGLTETVLINAGKAPVDMVTGTTLTNLYGGQVTIAAADIAGGTDNAFDIIYPKIPRSVCNDVIAASSPIFVELLVGGTAVKDATTPNPTPAQVATACNNDSNVITFRGRT